MAETPSVRACQTVREIPSQEVSIDAPRGAANWVRRGLAWFRQADQALAELECVQIVMVLESTFFTQRIFFGLGDRCRRQGGIQVDEAHQEGH
ncbi:hypothetical protein [Mesorhizobium sp. dw_380]|uniref:hypothetical protein n=1 Tax=Mesorhizobium sp. dw_380 TaxID=2812001 RepID=UPI001BDF45C2|nr:hypothetical protein [Mesorhizobium sp. dw_380]